MAAPTRPTIDGAGSYSASKLSASGTKIRQAPWLHSWDRRRRSIGSSPKRSESQGSTVNGSAILLRSQCGHRERSALAREPLSPTSVKAFPRVRSIFGAKLGVLLYQQVGASRILSGAQLAPRLRQETE
jgi:hypothetical protein